VAVLEVVGGVGDEIEAEIRIRVKEDACGTGTPADTESVDIVKRHGYPPYFL
jgi:hypothetical protein